MVGLDRLDGSVFSDADGKERLGRLSAEGEEKHVNENNDLSDLNDPNYINPLTHPEISFQD